MSIKQFKAMKTHAVNTYSPTWSCSGYELKRYLTETGAKAEPHFQNPKDKF